MIALNKSGIAEFKNWIECLKEDPKSEIPLSLLSDNAHAYEIPGSSELPSRIFSSKYELAEELAPIVLEIETLRVSHECWPGIWSALGLFYFESICRQEDQGWAPNSSSYYIYGEHSGNKPKFYEHRVYGPVTLYRTSPSSVKPFFSGAPSVLGQYETSIGSNNELAGNSTILETLKRLYVREDGTLRPFTSTRKFAGSDKKWDTPGGIRRIPKVCKQLRRTYDLPGIKSADLLNLLPVEFHSWLEA